MSQDGDVQMAETDDPTANGHAVSMEGGDSPQEQTGQEVGSAGGRSAKEVIGDAQELQRQSEPVTSSKATPGAVTEVDQGDSDPIVSPDKDGQGSGEKGPDVPPETTVAEDTTRNNDGKSDKAGRESQKPKEVEGEKDRKKRESDSSHRRGEKEHSKDKRREKDKDREKDRDKDRGKDRDKDRDRGKDKDRGREKDKDRDRDRDKKDKERSPKRSRHSRERREKSSGRRSDRRESSRDRHKSRDRDRDRRSRRSSSRDRRRRSTPPRRDRRRRSPSSSSDEEFGGYVPRKRQEAPKSAAGYSTAYVDPYAALRTNTITSTDPAEIARQMQEQQLLARQLVLQQQAASAVAAASKTQREVYVGNLVQGLVTEEALRQLFNSTMRAAFPEKQVPGLDPVVNVSMHSEGRYAFVELRSPEMASAALQLSNQVQLLGQPISVGRPSGYVDPSSAQQAAAQAATALAAFQTGATTIDEATTAMNAINVPGLSASAPPVAGGSSPGPAALPIAPPIAPPAASSTQNGPTCFLQVEGMVTPEVLADDAEYAEVIEDLQEECGKYGHVEKVLVPRPANPASSATMFGTNNFGKAFVQFRDVGSCSQAKAAIHGRLFAGITVQALFVSQAVFISMA